MLYGHYIEFVKQRAGFTSIEEAVRAIDAVFEVLVERIPSVQANNLCETLPIEMRRYQRRAPWPEPFGLDEFLERVARKQKVDPATALIHARAVLSVLAEFAPSPELLSVLDEIPKEMRRLFAW